MDSVAQNLTLEPCDPTKLGETLENVPHPLLLREKAKAKKGDRGLCSHHSLTEACLSQYPVYPILETV